ncbi:hypothetical protein S40288_11765 [Stachybotrys chartarum IBT 40288]|nr:hypothetical protein S40288_11765 [Stachybotrys chartarum IBT 40288]
MSSRIRRKNFPEPCSVPDGFIHVTEQGYPTYNDAPAPCQEEVACDPPSAEPDTPNEPQAVEDPAVEDMIPSRHKSDKKPKSYEQRYPKDYLAILHPDTSEQTLRKYIVQPTTLPIVYDAAIGRKNVQAFLNGNNPGASALDAKAVWQTATKMYYNENSFTVRHYQLHHFFYNPENTNGLDEPITALIRRITVIITTELRRWSDEECHEMLEQLRILMKCSDTANITLHIVGVGDAAGMDWPTQEAIRVIAPVVKDLIAKFKGFIINKVLLRDSEMGDKPDHQIRNITPYWSEPGLCRMSSAEEIMMAQLQVWTKPSNTA